MTCYDDIYLIGKPLVVPGRMPAIPCCVIGLSTMLTLNCLEVGSPVPERPSPELILVRPAVGARLDWKDADGGLAKARRPGVAERKLAEPTYSDSSLCPRRDLGRSYLLWGLTIPVGGLSILFEVLGASCSRRQRVIGRSLVLPEVFLSPSISREIRWNRSDVRRGWISNFNCLLERKNIMTDDRNQLCCQLTWG